ncbi:MAG TPA: FGGY family carbohydrate kinase [Candidatus Limnocylindrales bacterium]|nr:FGGY family carbohydrate kinase [Candidatus Limnocylindrales bacterium]
MSRDLLLAIDQGTTSTRAIAFDRRLRAVATAAVPLVTHHPRPDWAEQDAEAILDSVVVSVAGVLDEVGGPGRILAAGLANQGETVVAWDADTMLPLAPAVSWQCRRSLPIVERLRARGVEDEIRARTGLPLDPYYSAGKLAWLLTEHAAVRAAAEAGTVRLGTVDAWLTARLGDRGPLTDSSTASRTQLLSLAGLGWDPELLGWFGVARDALPRLVPTAGDLGTLRDRRWGGSIPLRAMACDQQAALAGHAGFDAGAMKATYGTGVFIVANAGARRAPVGLVETSIGWSLPDGSTPSVLQAGVLTAGSFVAWLRDELRLVESAADTEVLAESVPDTAGVRVLPALAGLAAPWWRPDVRAVIAGLTPGAGPAHIARAALDGIAHSVADVVDAMADALSQAPGVLRADGGMTANGYLMRRQADLLGIPVELASSEESTALGAAALAGIGAGVVNPADVARANPSRARLEPRLSRGDRTSERAAWREFVASVGAR